jgi:antitoxin HicB
VDVDYGLKISLLSDDDGGGYLVEVPDLPGCMTDGDTLEEAIRKAGEAIESWIQVAKECGKKIPEKKYYSSEDDYSGKLTLRMPKSLHKELTQAAAEQGVSINQLILYFLSKGIGQVTTEMASTNTRKGTVYHPTFVEN